MKLVDLAAPVTIEDATFVADCLAELFAPIAGRADELRAYLDTHLGSPTCAMLLIEEDGQRAGVITLVRFAMPRYLGHGYEIQELVIAPAFRRRGVATAALQAVAERCRADASARKVIIRTNVPGAQVAYASVWSATDLTSYQKMLNLLQAE